MDRERQTTPSNVPTVHDRPAADRRPHSDWRLRHIQIAGALGLGLGAAGQLAVYGLAHGEAVTSPWQRLTALVFGTLGWVFIALVLAMLTQSWLRSRIGRGLAVGLSTIVLTALCLALTSGFVLRILSGSFLTAGALQFSLNSSEHFIHAAVGRYSGWALLLIALTGGSAGAFGWGLSRAAKGASLGAAPGASRQSARVPSIRYLVALSLLGAVLVAGFWQRSDSRFMRGVFVSTPLLALFSSLDSSFELDRVSQRPASLTGPPAPPGPPLAAGEAWQAGLRTLHGPRPNVLLLMLESVAASHLSYLGYERPTTPELDRLAQQGLDFRRVWVAATHSNYSQPAILSALFPRRGHGLDQYERLDYPRVLFHDALHLIGYDTATISSQDETWQGMLRFQQTGTPTFFWYVADYEGETLDSGTEKDVPDDKTTDVILDWLGRKRDRPWALYVNFQATHFPYNIPPEAKRRWEPSEPTRSTYSYLGYPQDEVGIVKNRYDNALCYMDEQIGRIRRYLEETGQFDRTLWVITSDHGELFYDKGLVTHGRTLYDLEARVPLVFHWPAKLKPAVRHDPVSHLDLLPTLLDLLGVPPHPAFQGSSVKEPVAEPGKKPIYLNIQGLRFADALICWPWKLIHERTSKQTYLFHLERDPAEDDNLLDRYPEVSARLADTLRSQLLAQLDYHREDSDERTKRYAPRLQPCPDLPAVSPP